LPYDEARASSIFATAHFTPDAKRAAYGLVIRVGIGKAELAQNAGGVGDRLRASGDNPSLVKAATTSRLENDHQPL